MTIYLDIVFLENLIMNSIIMYATGIILKINIKHYRVLISSTIRSNIFDNIVYYRFRSLFEFVFEDSFINNYGIYSI